METIECIAKRRSIRRFIRAPVEREKLEKLIDAARLAPTARNLQPWEFIVVTDRAKLERISELATYGKFISEAGACIVICGERENNHLVEDCSAATMSITLAATDMGLASCWVAGWKRTYNKEVMELLSIPDSREIVSFIPVGYSDSGHQAPKKRALSDVIRWEQY